MKFRVCLYDCKSNKRKNDSKFLIFHDFFLCILVCGKPRYTEIVKRKVFDTNWMSVMKINWTERRNWRFREKRKDERKRGKKLCAFSLCMLIDCAVCVRNERKWKSSDVDTWKWNNLCKTCKKLSIANFSLNAENSCAHCDLKAYIYVQRTHTHIAIYMFRVINIYGIPTYTQAYWCSSHHM